MRISYRTQAFIINGCEIFELEVHYIICHFEKLCQRTWWNIPLTHGGRLLLFAWEIYWWLVRTMNTHPMILHPKNIHPTTLMITRPHTHHCSRRTEVTASWILSVSEIFFRATICINYLGFFVNKSTNSRMLFVRWFKWYNIMFDRLTKGNSMFKFNIYAS